MILIHLRDADDYDDDSFAGMTIHLRDVDDYDDDSSASRGRLRYFEAADGVDGEDGEAGPDAAEADEVCRGEAFLVDEDADKELSGGGDVLQESEGGDGSCQQQQQPCEPVEMAQR